MDELLPFFASLGMPATPRSLHGTQGIYPQIVDTQIATESGSVLKRSRKTIHLDSTKIVVFGQSAAQNGIVSPAIAQRCVRTLNVVAPCTAYVSSRFNVLRSSKRVGL